MAEIGEGGGVYTTEHKVLKITALKVVAYSISI